MHAHGETGPTARLLPLTVDGLIWAASMVILDANRRRRRVPRLALWSLTVGIVATIDANMAHGLDHGPIGALVSAWPALALIGSYELLMTLIKTAHTPTGAPASTEADPAYAPGEHQHAPPIDHKAPPVAPETPPAFAEAPPVEHVVRARHRAGASQRTIARELDIDGRKVKRIIDQPTPTPTPPRRASTHPTGTARRRPRS